MSATGFKAQYGWSIALYRPIIPWLSQILMKCGFSANGVSWLSFFATCVGLVFYLGAGDTLLFRLTVVLWFALATALDVADGYVARLTHSAGRFGATLDAVLDLFRYNLFFIAVLIKHMPSLIWCGVVAVYAGLATLSLGRTAWRAYTGRARETLANEQWAVLLPKRYREFCLSRGLLYNPLNFEDQLNLVIFIAGVASGQELLAILVCLIARIFEVFIAAFRAAKKWKLLGSHPGSEVF